MLRTIILKGLFVRVTALEEIDNIVMISLSELAKDLPDKNKLHYYKTDINYYKTHINKKIIYNIKYNGQYLFSFVFKENRHKYYQIGKEVNIKDVIFYIAKKMKYKNCSLLYQFSYNEILWLYNIFYKKQYFDTKIRSVVLNIVRNRKDELYNLGTLLELRSLMEGFKS